MGIAGKSYITYNIFEQYPEVKAFSTTRHGGCSEGNYASMNCTPYTGDSPEAVQRNLSLLCNTLGCLPEQMVIPYQTHGTESLVIDKAFLHLSADLRRERLQGIDALITSEPDVCLCISTADCIPILLHDHTHQVIAAVHAGWRGTAQRILWKTLVTMAKRYGTTGQDLTAVIGPGISAQAYQVGSDVYEAFEEQHFDMRLIARPPHILFKCRIDLPLANAIQLYDFGVPREQVMQSGICTYSHPEEFFSARRLGILSGRILNGIMITPEKQ
ncbi:MAG: peptidoglycan editing factor PgeF [Bacteroides sp.]|nr:peptidoglycan editing factor PgeF [Bacteroides sp.]